MGRNALWLLCAGLVIGSPAPQPTPPGIPSSTAASNDLNSLVVAAPLPMTGYSRDQFKTWDTIQGACNTREYVIKRDGLNVQTSSSCTATSGTWLSPYDGATWTKASDLDIDHMVPLANAWISGASKWTASQREAFANDVTRPQLWAVTDNVNEAKGDSSPDAWKPPLSSFYCTYAESWVAVKAFYGLTVTGAEKAALGSMLGGCGKDSGSGSGSGSGTMTTSAAGGSATATATGTTTSTGATATATTSKSAGSSTESRGLLASIVAGLTACLLCRAQKPETESGVASREANVASAGADHEIESKKQKPKRGQINIGPIEGGARMDKIPGAGPDLGRIAF